MEQLELPFDEQHPVLLGLSRIVMTPKEKVAATDWMTLHRQQPHPQQQPFFKLEHFVTGIGTAHHVRCQVCHASKNVTDYDTW